MNTFIKSLFIVTWTSVMLFSGCMIGRIGNPAAPSILPPKAPPSKYELLLNRHALTVKDEKGDSYILKKSARGQYTTECTYEVFPATEAETQPQP